MPHSRVSSSMMCPCRRWMLPRREPRPATHRSPADQSTGAGSRAGLEVRPIDGVTLSDGRGPGERTPTPPIWRRSHPRWQGVPPVPNSNPVATSVTDAEFFDGMRFARTGWPGTHGPWRACLALSGLRLKMALRLSSRAGRGCRGQRWSSRRAVRLAGSRAAARTLPSPGLLEAGDMKGWSVACNGQGPYVLGRLALGRDGHGGNGKCLALVPRRMRGCAMNTQIPRAAPTMAGPAVPRSQMRTG